MFWRQPTDRTGLALVVALLLVLQTVFVALALGRNADVQLDAYGNPLCITSGEHSPPADQSDHGTLPGCCRMGCSIFVAAVGPGQGQTSLDAPLFFTRVELGGRRISVSVVGPRYSQSNPRAPPLMA